MGGNQSHVVELTGEMMAGKMGMDDDDVRIECGIYKRYSKLLPHCKAMDWGREMMGKDAIMDHGLHRTGSRGGLALRAVERERQCERTIPSSGTDPRSWKRNNVFLQKQNIYIPM